MTGAVHITDVSLRDGLQNQTVHVLTATKLELAARLAEAGVVSLEATSFVSPKAVPQMADAAEVVQGLQARLPHVRISALVPNLRGLTRAVQAACTEVAVVLCASEAMSRSNVNMGLAQALDESTAVLAEAVRLGLRTRAYVAVAFDCPFEGPTPLDRVQQMAAHLHAAGADELVLADTIGSAFPAEVGLRVRAVADAVPVGRLAMHLHDTRGMGVVNAWAALEAGVRRFDASMGGIGGCPFAPGAAGNLATEDLVLLAERSGFATGIHTGRLMSAVEAAGRVLGRPLGGHSANWLRRQALAAGQGAAPALQTRASDCGAADRH